MYGLQRWYNFPHREAKFSSRFWHTQPLLALDMICWILHDLLDAICSKEERKWVVIGEGAEEEEEDKEEEEEEEEEKDEEEEEEEEKEEEIEKENRKRRKRKRKKNKKS